MIINNYSKFFLVNTSLSQYCYRWVNNIFNFLFENYELKKPFWFLILIFLYNILWIDTCDTKKIIIVLQKFILLNLYKVMLILTIVSHDIKIDEFSNLVLCFRMLLIFGAFTFWTLRNTFWILLLFCW